MINWNEHGWVFDWHSIIETRSKRTCNLGLGKDPTMRTLPGAVRDDAALGGGTLSSFPLSLKPPLQLRIVLYPFMPSPALTNLTLRRVTINCLSKVDHSSIELQSFEEQPWQTGTRGGFMLVAVPQRGHCLPYTRAISAPFLIIACR